MPKRKKNLPPQHPCPKCQQAMDALDIHVVEGECWKCDSRMMIAFGLGEGTAHSPTGFSSEELAAARKAGAKLEITASRTMGTSYMANICLNCGALTGDHYLHDFWYLATAQTKVMQSMACLDCVALESP